MVIALAFGGSIFLVNDVAAQDPFTTDAKRDSLANAQYLVKTQKTTDAQTLSDLKHNKSDTKAQAKEMALPRPACLRHAARRWK